MAENLSLSRQIMDLRQGQEMLNKASGFLTGYYGPAEIERVLAGIHAAEATLKWLVKHEAAIKGALDREEGKTNG